MFRLILIATFLLTLPACSTLGVNSCLPPDFAMVKGSPLAPLPEAGMTMQEAVDQWQIDVGQYLDLSARHDTLVGWVSEKC